MDFVGLGGEIVTCRRCPRLVRWREAVAHTRRRAYMNSEYWGKPVPGFGDGRARILAVGLAPGAHGSNRTGRQFTGDASGRFLFPALHRAGLSNKAESISLDDGLRLSGLYLTAACRCVPPGNEPSPEEVQTCRPYLEREIQLLAPRVIVCLGRLAFGTVAKIHTLRPSEHKFSHGACHAAPAGLGRPPRWILCSFHPSQQNTVTGKLTPAMFDGIWQRAMELAEDAED